MLLITPNLSEETYTTYQAYTPSKSAERQECEMEKTLYTKIHHCWAAKKGSKVFYRS